MIITPYIFTLLSKSFRSMQFRFRFCSLENMFVWAKKKEKCLSYLYCCYLVHVLPFFGRFAFVISIHLMILNISDANLASSQQFKLLRGYRQILSHFSIFILRQIHLNCIANIDNIKIIHQSIVCFLSWFQLTLWIQRIWRLFEFEIFFFSSINIVFLKLRIKIKFKEKVILINEQPN